MTPDKVREILERYKTNLKNTQDNLQVNTEELQQVFTQAIEALEAIEQAKDELPERKVWTDEEKDRYEDIMPDQDYENGRNSAIDEATPILAKKVLENAKLRKEIKDLKGEK